MALHLYHLPKMHGGSIREGGRADSYVEVRFIFFIAASILLCALLLPAFIWASDWEGDNLPDSWKAQYGLGTNVYDPTNLVGWWQMEPNTNGVVSDRWTNQIDGSPTNFAVDPYVAGIFSNALAFTTNAQVNFSTNSALNSTTNQFTFSTWFQSTTNQGLPATIVTSADANTNAWSLGAATDGTALVSFSDAYGDVQTIGPSTQAIQLYDGTWHQVAVTYDASHVARMYVDGENQGSETITGWTSGPVASFTFGAATTNSVNPPYALDETRLYNRALSQFEVAQLPVTYSDLNGSGLTVFEDYLEGLNPLATNTLVTSDFVNSGLAGYYGGQTPTLTKSSGDCQIVAAGTFETNPLVVHVADGSGTALVGAPVTFAVATGSDGALSQTSGGSLSQSISCTTDGSGNATIYYQAGPETLQKNIIQATAVSSSGNVVVAFKAYCGVQDGLALWLKADAGVTQDGSGNVSLWADQGADHNDVSQTTTEQDPTFVPVDENGKPAIAFNGSQYLQANDAATLKPANITMLVVGKYSASSDPYGSFISKTTSGDQDDGYGMGLLDGPLGGWVNDYIAGAAESTVPAGQYETMACVYDQSNVTFRLNGQTLATQPFTDPINNPDGVPLFIGTTNYLNYVLTGSIAEVIIYNRALSPTELQQVEVYLADKYGLYNPDATWLLAYSSDVQTLINTYQWNKAQADAYVAFFNSSPPVPATGLMLWLNAGSGVSVDSDNNVLQWVDQGPFGHVAVPTSDVGAPVLQNDSKGKPTLGFNGGEALFCPDYIPANGDLTIVSIASLVDPNNFNVDFMLGGSSLDTGTVRSYGNYYGSDEFYFYYGAATGGLFVNPNEQAVHTVTFQRDSGAVNFYSRGLYNDYGNATVSDLTSGFFVGDSADFNQPWNGTVSEVLVYNRILSDTERNQAEAYLADKYGVYQPTATWILAYGSDVQELIAENEWSKSQADAYVASLSGTVMAPTVSPVPGHYSSTQTVTVTSDTSDATIYYTTNGTTPTTSSASVANGGQITVSATSQLKLLAADGVALNSPIATAIYQIGSAGQLEAGNSFTMALKPDGTVWTWGDNGRGQQGDNQANNPVALPQEVPAFSGVADISAVGDHALAVDNSGNVWAWGADDVSQGGDGGTTDLYVPTQISSLSGISAVYAGPVNGFAVDGDGNLYGWGDNGNGQLGDGTYNAQSTPEAITSVTNVLKVASSSQFTLVLKSDGTVWATGYNGDGELGDGTQNSETYFQQVGGLSNVKDIAVGNGQAVVLLSDGSVWTWGYGGDGELGNGVYGSRLFPGKLLGLPRGVAVRAADSKSFVVLADGTVRAFGGNNEGEMGIGNTQSQASPVQPTGISNVILLAAGSGHVVVCTSTGAFYGWGDNSSFMLTQDFSTNSWTSGTDEVRDTRWSNIISVATGETTTIGLKSDGTVWSVGAGGGGMLGQGDWYSTERPIQVLNLTNITKISAGGGGSAYAIDSSGNLWAWGSNWDGQLGIGSYDSANTASQVASVSNVISVSPGSQHVLAVQSDGTVWAAGDDSQNELGDGGTDAQNEPIQVSGFTSATQVAAGNNTSFVLKSNGTVWAWGQNDSGQLGLGTTGNVSSPTQITGLPAMAAISAWGVNGMGLDTSGNVWNWGTLGNSDGTPLEQPGLTGVTTIAAGYYHDLAVKSDGTLWGVGANFENQLGNAGGTNYSISEFAQLPNVQGAVAIAASYGSTFFVTQDGSVAGLGNCPQGQLAGNLGTYDYLPKALFGIAMSENPPTVSITSPAISDSETMGTAIQFQASATASSGSIVRVDYYMNGVKLGGSVSGGTWNFSWTPTISGELSFEAVAIDSSGVEQISAPVLVPVAYSNSNGAPTNVTVTAGPPGTVYLGWTDTSATANSILIQEKNGEGDWITIATLTNSTRTSYTISGLTSGQDYSFQVVAVAGESGNSGTAVTYSAGSPNLPVLTKINGDIQDIPASTFALAPLVVQVKDVAGNPLAGIPVTFSFPIGSDGGLTSVNGGEATSTCTISTNKQGRAIAYYKAGPEALHNNTVSARASSGSGTVTVSFLEHCGLRNGLALWFEVDAGVTADGSGNVSQWADQVSGLTVAQNSTSAPTLSANVINGEPGVVFNGAQRLSASNTVSLDGDWTFILCGESNDTASERYAIGLGDVSAPGGTRGFGNNENNAMLATCDYYTNSEPFLNNGEDDISEAVYTKSNSTVSFYERGAETGTGEVYTSTTTSGVNIGDISNGSYPKLWDGTIHEILVYSRALSDTERHGIEGYLADKYGLYNVNSTWQLAYSSDVQEQITANRWSKAQADAYVAFLATDPEVPHAGLNLWLKADAGVTADGDGNVSAWADQTPNGNNAGIGSGSSVTVVSDGTGGKPMLHFNGSSYLSVPDAASLRPNYVTVLAVAQEDSSSTYQTLIGRSYTSSSSWNYPYVSWDVNLFGDNGGNYLRSAMTTSGTLTENTVANTYNISQPYIFGWKYDGTTQKVLLSGTITGSTATSGVIDYGGGAANICIGARSVASPAEYLNADVSEILVYDHALSDEEEAQAEGYLADKYGLYDPNATWLLAYSTDVQEQITAHQWSKSQADAFVAFEATSPPIPGVNLAAWLKADVGVTADGSGYVSQWTDQGPGGNNASQTTSGIQPTLVTNAIGTESVIHFDGVGSYLALPRCITDDFAMVVVYRSSQGSGTGGQWYSGAGIVDGEVTGVVNDFGMSLDENGNLLTGIGNPDTSINSSSEGYNDGRPHVVTFSRTESTGFFSQSIDSNLQGTATGNTGPLSSPPRLTIGATQTLGQYFGGDVAEVLLYARNLSSAEQAGIEQYLEDKYGIYSANATWMGSYPLPIQAEIVKHQWSRAQVDSYIAFQSAHPDMPVEGLTMWFKADSGVTVSGGQVTAIADQTGNYSLSQSNSANQPTLVTSAINGEPAIQFSGNQWLANSTSRTTSLDGDMTIISVGMSTDVTDDTDSLYLGANGGDRASRAIGYATAEAFDTSGSSALGGAVPALSTFVVETATLDASLTNVSFYQNGVLTGTNVVSGLQNLGTGITMGAIPGGINGWQGEIAEQLVYDHKLSPSELQGVETYLSAKYGLAYSPVAPGISPDGGDYTESQTITITANQPSGGVHYTLDGSTPTSDSPTYTGSFTLASSALVQAAVFSSIDGSLQSQIAGAQFYINDPNESGLAPVLTGLSTTSVSASEIDLGWTAGTSATYSQIYVYRSVNGGGYYLIAILDPTDTSFQDTTATSGNSYSYKIGTYNQEGVSLGAAGDTTSPTSTPTLTIQITTPAGATPLP